MSKSAVEPGKSGRLGQPEFPAPSPTGREVIREKPGISNLLDIMARPRGGLVAELEVEYEVRGYGDFKKDVAEAPSGSRRSAQLLDG